ncbi:Proton-dependent oligopeptide transporter family [Dillenia turbinata]|uniref:Proton-dependent oligopeptide transporter family n=1 Tax=Dillenia turbinata TaxID=194707 RepID=A0AAN8UX98_9MAGN
MLKLNVVVISYDPFAGTELSERICAMGISMNLVTYLVGQLHLSSSTSATVFCGISAGTTVIAVTILICQTRLYRYKRPQGSPLTVIWRVLFLAMKNRNLPYPAHPSLFNQYHMPRSPTWRDSVMDYYAAANGNSNDHWMVSTVTQVEEVKMVLKVIPIWSTSIFFWTIYSQMTTFTIEQATFMNRNIGSFVFFLVGAGEAFAYVGQLEFFIREAPERMKSMSTGFFVSSLLVSLVDDAADRIWLQSNLNKGKLDYFYWMLPILGFINFLVFLVIAMRHQYKYSNI